ncbi:hypothetical protein BD310DRAFT_729812 [Dichomitus squalens]|uniref:Uncharacterized protein n=1 Tax=Dichomitus squalens TaxID=114155 RepID=A0A4Q9PKV8_9APHY|nr:hypothetical protein BD310DRAFT_729812 [Dichomitus squalens]
MLYTLQKDTAPRITALRYENPRLSPIFPRLRVSPSRQRDSGLMQRTVGTQIAQFKSVPHLNRLYSFSIKRKYQRICSAWYTSYGTLLGRATNSHSLNYAGFQSQQAKNTTDLWLLGSKAFAKQPITTFAGVSQHVTTGVTHVLRARAFC